MFGFYFFIGASAIKSWEKSRIFRYGLHEDFLVKGKKTQWGAMGERVIIKFLISIRKNRSKNHTKEVYLC